MKFHRTARLTAPVLIVLILFSSAAGQSVAEEVRARFHHVRLNVTNVDESIRFYSRVFGAVPIKFHGVADALSGLAADADARETMGGRARDRFEAQFSVDRMVAGCLAAFAEFRDRP